MTRQTITVLTDDLDGGDAQETVHFALDGITYEIDLSEKNAASLRDFMERFTQAGTRTGRIGQTTYPTRRPGSTAKQPPAPHTAQFAADREQNQAIREWANRNGFQVSPRGRIPIHVVNAFHSGAGRQAMQAGLSAQLDIFRTPADVEEPEEPQQLIEDVQPPAEEPEPVPPTRSRRRQPVSKPLGRRVTAHRA